MMSGKPSESTWKLPDGIEDHLEAGASSILDCSFSFCSTYRFVCACVCVSALAVEGASLVCDMCSLDTPVAMLTSDMLTFELTYRSN